MENKKLIRPSDEIRKRFLKSQVAGDDHNYENIVKDFQGHFSDFDFPQDDIDFCFSIFVAGMVNSLNPASNYNLNCHKAKGTNELPN